MTASNTTPVSIDMIRKLVGFPTVSRDSNLELIHLLLFETRTGVN